MRVVDQLCARCGIALEYSDIWGNRRQVEERTKRAILAAMGFPAETEAELRKTLEALEAASWRRLLPPVQVVRAADAPWRISVNIPVGERRDELGWALTLENGERHEGSFRPEEQDFLLQGEAGGAAYGRYSFPLPHVPGLGYHRFELTQAGREPCSMSLIVAPDTCYQPAAFAADGRVWGPAVQLYGVRSDRNWGIGDFGDLKGVVEFCAEEGAGVVGVSPLHALFPDNPEHASPYGPSSRLFLNLMHLDIEAIPDFTECESARKTVREAHFQEQLRSLRGAGLVQYSAVSALKFAVLEHLYRHFRNHHLETGSPRGQFFRAFQGERGEALRRQALFEALQAHFRNKDGSIWGWPAWPAPYRDPSSTEVASFCESNLSLVEFYEYLQWQASLQLASAGRRAWEVGLEIGLLLDLAVGVERGGAETWAQQDLYALGASIGAPPDDFNLHGQDWGLPPLIPRRLVDACYAPFIATLRENMAAAGALRIDHVMGLMRLFWVPPGCAPTDGAYVSYPFADLLGILALESQRNHCLVVGEDLGTVPDEVRKALQANHVLSYRLMYFERDEGGAFKAPAAYPEQAVVAVTTHDLATLAGYWQGNDIVLRSELGLFPTEQQREEQIVARAQARTQLLAALEREDLLPADISSYPVSRLDVPPEFVQAVHAYLARTPSKLMLVQFEDVLGQSEQPNLPGTTDQHPNWRRKLSLNLEEWRNCERISNFTKTLRDVRGSSQ